MSVTDNVLQPHKTSVNPQLHRGEFQSEPTLQFSSSKLMVFFGRGRSPTRLALQLLEGHMVEKTR